MARREDLDKFARTRLATTDTSLLALTKLTRLARLDIGREMRKGLPEIILAEGKSPVDVAKIAEAMAQLSGRAIVSRADSSHLRAIRRRRIQNSIVQFFSKSRIIIIKQKSYKVGKTGGRVGILTAGTSDIPVAEEAQILADEMGCVTKEFYDVGVAGLHRLFKPVSDLLRWDADVILVV